MSLDPALVALQVQSVVVASVSTRTASGQPTYGGSTTLSARVEEDVRQLEGPLGTSITTTHRIYLNGTASPAPEAGMRLWLPGESGAANARVVHKVETIPGLTAGIIDHYEVMV